MADAEEKAPAAAPAPGGMPIKLIIIVAVVALVTGLGGAFAVVKLMGGGGGHSNPEEAKTETAAAKPSGGHGEPAGKSGGHAPGAIFDLDPFIVNLADSPEIRYLKLTVKLEVDGVDPAVELAPRMPQIRDTILVLLSSKDAAAVKSANGKVLLRDEITKRINDLLPKPAVHAAYFTEFVVQ